MAAGEVDERGRQRAASRYLQELPARRRQLARCAVDTVHRFSARVFYLKYHGYSAYFPLWALARYRNMRRTNERRMRYGM